MIFKRCVSKVFLPLLSVSHDTWKRVSKWRSQWILHWDTTDIEISTCIDLHEFRERPNVLLLSSLELPWATEMPTHGHGRSQSPHRFTKTNHPLGIHQFHAAPVAVFLRKDQRLTNRPQNSDIANQIRNLSISKDELQFRKFKSHTNSMLALTLLTEQPCPTNPSSPRHFTSSIA